MHKTDFYLPGRRVTYDFEMCTMHVYRVVLCPFEPGIQNLQLAFASGHLDEVGKSGTGTACPQLGFAENVVVGEIFGVLAYDAEVSEEVKPDILQGYVFTFMDKSASFIPYGVSHLIDLPGFYSVGSVAVIEADDFVSQLGNLHKVVERGGTTEGFIDSRVEYLRGYGLREAPPFSYPPEFSSGYFIPGVIVYAGCHVGITDFEHRHFGYGGVCCHEGEITEHDVFATVYDKGGHLSVGDEPCSSSVYDYIPQSFEPQSYVFYRVGIFGRGCGIGYVIELV